MDKMSIKLLSYLKNQDEPVSKKDIVAQFDKTAEKSLTYLKDSGFISEGSDYVMTSLEFDSGRAKWQYIPNGMYEIASPGLDFLEHKPGNDFDRWLNRFNILYPVIGGALLSKPLWAVIEWIWDWILQILAG